VREAAASGIGQLVEVTSPKFLQPFLIKITGPLIRIVGDRFPSAVKAAILHTLGKYYATHALQTCNIYSTYLLAVISALHLLLSAVVNCDTMSDCVLKTDPQTELHVTRQTITLYIPSKRLFQRVTHTAQ
jgi:hypothetical protein